MNSVSFGDLAQSQMLRRSGAAAQQRLSRLAEELASGQRADKAAAAGGDFKLLAGIERSLGLLDTFRTTAEEAAATGAGIQVALETVQVLAEDAGNALTGAGTQGTAVAVNSAASAARQQLDAAVAALNANIGDRYLFSGTATDRKAVVAPDAILAALSGATAGSTTAGDVLTAVRDWFDAPPGGGGFLDLAFGGAGAGSGPFPVGEGEAVAIPVTAADPALLRVLEGLALGAMVGNGLMSGDPGARAQVLRSAGETLMSAGGPLSELRGAVGTAEAAVDSAATRNRAEAAALGIARGGLVAADPYETATALEEARSQLEMIYLMTARLSGLSLTEYLR